MKDFLAKIWVPALLVMLAATQTFGIDAGRSANLRRIADSLKTSSLDDSTALAGPAVDSLEAAEDSTAVLAADSTFILDFKNDSIPAADTVKISPRDTIKVPDSLKVTDPVRYRYYIELKDSTTRFATRDSLLQAGETSRLLIYKGLDRYSGCSPQRMVRLSHQKRAQGIRRQAASA